MNIMCRATRRTIAAPLAIAMSLSLLTSASAGYYPLQIGSWNVNNNPVDTHYGPDSGREEMREYIPSNGSSRYIYIKGYDLVYTSQQTSNLRGSGGNSGRIVTHAFDNNKCNNIDQAANLNATTWTSSNLPSARFERVDQATCPGGRSNPSNELYLYFDKNSVAAGTYYYADVEYRDPAWNSSQWACCGYGNGDMGKLGMSQYIDICCWLPPDKKDWRYGFFCAVAYNNRPGLNATQACYYP